MKTIYSLFICLFLINPSSHLKAESTCFGSTSKGRLGSGVKLPTSGKNFVSYSYLGELLGRVYMHSEVKEILLDTYSKLLKVHPDVVFKYGETGFKHGGRFKPHKTHRNGLSTDVFKRAVMTHSSSKSLRQLLSCCRARVVY